MYKLHFTLHLNLQKQLVTYLIVFKMSPGALLLKHFTDFKHRLQWEKAGSNNYLNALYFAPLKLRHME